MNAGLSVREKCRLARYGVGIAAVGVSYACLILTPLSVAIGMSWGAGRAMTAGATGSPDGHILLLPLLVGAGAWSIAAILGPGLIIRLLCLPSGVGYFGAVYLLHRLV